MKTKVFVEQVRHMGYAISFNKNKDYISIYDEVGTFVIGVVELNKMHSFSVNPQGKQHIKLVHLIIHFAGTPINDRDEPQKFHLKHKHLNLENNQNYLSLDAYGYYLSGDTGKKDSDVQTEFTQEEIDSLPFKVDSDTWDQDDVNKNDDVIVSKYYQDAKPNVKPKRKGYV